MRELLGEQLGVSSEQIQFYIRLIELIPELLDMVDIKKLNFTVRARIGKSGISIFNNCIVVKALERKVVLSEKKFTKYFLEDYSETDMEKVIESLLEQWK